MQELHPTYKLLFDALLRMRAEGAETENGVAFYLADLFHQLPNRLQAVSDGAATLDEVLDELHERAREKGLERWVDEHLSQEAVGRE